MLASATFLAALPRRGVSAGPGPTVELLDWPDPSRKRTLPLKVYRPAGAGPFPVVLFSHGLGGSREGGKAWGEHWSANGLLSIHIQHPGSDEFLWRGKADTLEQAAAALRAGMNAGQLIARSRDVRFVLDELARRQGAASSFASAADLSRVGMSGHSFGAVTTQAVSGERYAGTTGATISLRDPRIRAAIAFSPSYRAGDAAFEFGAIAIPFLSVTGTADGEVLPDIGVSPQQRTVPFENMPPGGKYLLVLDGADHMTFNGQRRTLARASAQEAVAKEPAHFEWIRRVTLAFWRATLLDDSDARSWLDRRLADELGAAGTFKRR